ncbi:hypothetical protein E2C01_088662 [Portunus trituberculatus]|uniref:Uncharacterized protein n=1 Tax=Portunus trituberculatus TaxID=210409 RepID=A0A5B7J9W6_PORTR|nr:hypothetical protein [Portunus trituberculatus]
MGGLPRGRPGGLSGGAPATLSPVAGLMAGRRTTLETVKEPSENLAVKCCLGNILGSLSGGDMTLGLPGTFSGEFLREWMVVVLLVTAGGELKC